MLVLAGTFPLDFVQTPADPMPIMYSIFWTLLQAWYMEPTLPGPLEEDAEAEKSRRGIGQGTKSHRRGCCLRECERA
jgi:hypothetical protein